MCGVCGVCGSERALDVSGHVSLWGGDQFLIAMARSRVACV